MPMLFGSVLRDTGQHLVFSIAVNKGDAREFGVCGQLEFAKRQIIEHPRLDGFDRIEVPGRVLLEKAKGCQPCD